LRFSAFFADFWGAGGRPPPDTGVGTRPSSARGRVGLAVLWRGDVPKNSGADYIFLDGVRVYASHVGYPPRIILAYPCATPVAVFTEHIFEAAALEHLHSETSTLVYRVLS
jgi:hypothetical protein